MSRSANISEMLPMTMAAAANQPGRRTRFSRVLRVITHARPHHIEFFRSLGPSKTFWGTVYVNPRDASEFAGRAPLSLF